ncbi:GIY-YIG nuclease family protein [Hymenobacter aerilatus]|uniref:GIY-YIG nuclease family protein n=1 Tax=Hymenobacter aerilatus TaxID=2932251 RepID=A0A8T9T020_9BACT|nr:GIY-YIG nuclease family protein [Hymenobacter aerilatus]UOR07475.1 GIY-YIG nuclease family protein [Hymenobacter aerilatus]
MKSIASLSELIKWCKSAELLLNTDAKREAAYDKGLISMLCDDAVFCVAWGNTNTPDGSWEYRFNINGSDADYGTDERFSAVTTNIGLITKITSSISWDTPPTSPNQGPTSTRSFTSATLENIKRTKRDYYTYVIEAEGLNMVKIGRAINVRSRLKQLQTGSPAKLYLLYSVAEDIEAELHQLLRFYRAEGEWFKSDTYVLDIIVTRMSKCKGGVRLSSKVNKYFNK